MDTLIVDEVEFIKKPGIFDETMQLHGDTWARLQNKPSCIPGDIMINGVIYVRHSDAANSGANQKLGGFITVDESNKHVKAAYDNGFRDGVSTRELDIEPLSPNVTIFYGDDGRPTGAAVDGTLLTRA